jgi:hypothetical protein
VTGTEGASEQVAACEGCQRPASLDPPFCCLPCAVTSRVGVNNGHSITCNRLAQKAEEATDA